MLALIAGALAARRMQALAVLLLAVLAGAAAAAAPMYATAAGQALASYELSAAAPDERQIRLMALVETQGLPDDRARAAIASKVARIAPNGFDTVLGAHHSGVAAGPTTESKSALVFREGVCERVSVTGTCPARTSTRQQPEVMISTNTAAHLGVGVGDTITYDRISLTVSGVYRPLNPRDAYWLGDEYLPPAAPGQTVTPAVGSASDAIFVAAQSPLVDHPDALFRSTADLFIPEHLLRTRPAEELQDQIAAAEDAARHPGFAASSQLPDLLDRVADNRRHLDLGVTLGACLLVLLCWLVLFMVIASAADERRPDQGALMLRGVQRRRLWALAIGEHALPALAAIPLACLAGLAATELLAGHTLPGDAEVTLDATALGYATAAAAGALAAVLVAQIRTLSTPVAELLRRVPARTRRWQAGISDIVAVSVAAAATVQLRTGGPPTGLALLAPIAAALAVGLLAARIAMLIGAVTGTTLLRTGRTATGLAILQLARQPRIRPLIALLTVVIGLLAFTAATRDVATTVYADRAAVEVGAPRVFGVDAMSRKHLLDATRAIDPDGRFAMAVVVADSGTRAGPVLAVDSARLPTVAVQHQSYGASLAHLGTTLRREPPTAPVLLRGRALVLAVAATYDPDKLEKMPGLYATVAGSTGSRQVKADKLVAPGTGDYLIRVPECVSECRLVSIQISVPRVTDPVEITVTELRHENGDTVLMTSAELARSGSWRRPDIGQPTAPDTSAGGGGLGLHVPPGHWTESIAAHVADAPYPLPAWMTRSSSIPSGSNQTYTGFDGIPTAVRVAGVADRLPRSVQTGMVVDLEYADRLSAGGQSGTTEVWLAAAAPTDVLDRLREQGLVVRYDRTITGAREAFDRHGPALALNFNLFAALAGVIIGIAGIVAAAAVEQRNRTTMLVALRRQGLPARAIRGGYGWAVLVAAAAGGLATATIWILTRDGQRLFRDGQTVVPPPAWPDVGWLASITLPAIAVFALTATAAGLVMAASVHRRASR